MILSLPNSFLVSGSNDAVVSSVVMYNMEKVGLMDLRDRTRDWLFSRSVEYTFEVGEITRTIVFLGDLYLGQFSSVLLDRKFIIVVKLSERDNVDGPGKTNFMFKS